MMDRNEKFYRDYSNTPRWKSFRVKVESTDLLIRAQRNLSDMALALVEDIRSDLRRHIDMQPEFQTSYSPVYMLPQSSLVAVRMYEASEIAGVGPMAAVAGAIAELVGIELMKHTGEIIIENGGDIWMSLIEPAVIDIHTGNMDFDGRVGIKIYPHMSPCGVCTSSGKVGHSFNYGNADSATIISPSAALADAVATQAANIVKSEDNIEASLSYAINIDTVMGALIIAGNRMGAQGDIELADPELETA